MEEAVAVTECRMVLEGLCAATAVGWTSGTGMVFIGLAAVRGVRRTAGDSAERDTHRRALIACAAAGGAHGHRPARQRAMSLPSRRTPGQMRLWSSLMVCGICPGADARVTEREGGHGVDEAGDRRGRRAEAAGGAVTALLAVAACAGHATKAELPWWAVLAVAVSTAGPAGWTGARMGGRRGHRDEPVPPGDHLPGHPAPNADHIHAPGPARLKPPSSMR